jgi:excisionase family DNA binding protein
LPRLLAVALVGPGIGPNREANMMYTIKQVAELLQVGTGLVSEFVHSGELDAIDVCLTRGKKKRFRIPDDALRQFLERRRVYVPPPRGRSVRRERPREVIDYFAPLKLEENGRRRLKVSAVAEYMGVKEDNVRQLIAYGHLTAVNVGGSGKENRYRIAEKELFAFVERSKHEPPRLRAARLPGPDFIDDLAQQPTNDIVPDGSAATVDAVRGEKDGETPPKAWAESRTAVIKGALSSRRTDG